VTSEQASSDMGHTRIVRELHELIAALDRRVPHVERVGETAIARAAAALRDEALKRIATLEREADATAASSERIQAPAYIQRRTSGDNNGAE
jgi:type VI protein secretion system component VasF